MRNDKQPIKKEDDLHAELFGLVSVIQVEAKKLHDVTEQLQDFTKDDLMSILHEHILDGLSAIDQGCENVLDKLVESDFFRGPNDE